MLTGATPKEEMERIAPQAIVALGMTYMPFV
jgi:hypothetical protein